MNKLGGAKQMKGCHPMGADGQKDYPDHAGGHMSQMSCRSVPVAAGGSAKASMIDGPFGGKVKA